MKRLGFTLIEVMVSVAIMLVVASVGLGMAARSSSKQRLNLEVEKLKVMINQARSYALTGKKISCVAALSGWQVRLAVNSYQLEEKCGASNFVRSTTNITSGVTISTLPSPNPILFKVLGQGTNISGQTTITLSVAGASPVNILVSDTGEIE